MTNPDPAPRIATRQRWILAIVVVGGAVELFLTVVSAATGSVILAIANGSGFASFVCTGTMVVQQVRRREAPPVGSRRYYTSVVAAALVGLVVVPLAGLVIGRTFPSARTAAMVVALVVGACLFGYLFFRARRSERANLS